MQKVSFEIINNMPKFEVRKYEWIVFYRMLSALLFTVLLLFCFFYVLLFAYVIGNKRTLIIDIHVILVIVATINYLFSRLPFIYSRFSKAMVIAVIAKKMSIEQIVKIAKIDGDHVRTHIIEAANKLGDSDYKKQLLKSLDETKIKYGKTVGVVPSITSLIELDKFVKTL